jgi:aspartate 1-decarboxylase
MQLSFLKSKIHRATITKADLDYEGSISIDEDLMDAANFLPGERVDVLDINNGERFTTYVIPAKRGSGDIQVNGAAARKTYKGDLIIIVTYCSLSEDEVENFKPIVVSVDSFNKVI